jgi:hypothetical protein
MRCLVTVRGISFSFTGIKVGGIDPPIPPGVGAYARGICFIKCKQSIRLHNCGSQIAKLAFVISFVMSSTNSMILAQKDLTYFTPDLMMSCNREGACLQTQQFTALTSVLKFCIAA